MKIRIPRALVAAWDAFGEWANVTIYRRGRIEARRIDVLLVFFGIANAIFYSVFYNWQTAVIGVLMYIAVLMIAMWML